MAAYLLLRTKKKSNSYFNLQLLLLCQVRSSVQVGFVTQNQGCEMPGTEILLGLSEPSQHTHFVATITT